MTALRSGDIDTNGPSWIYVPRGHKTAHHGHTRTIDLGPRAQAVLAPWLRPDDPDRFLFSPRDVIHELWEERRRARKTPLTPTQRARRRK